MSLVSVVFIYLVVIILGLLYLKITPRGALVFIFFYVIAFSIIINFNISHEIMMLFNEGSSVSGNTFGLIFEEFIKIIIPFIIFLYFVNHRNEYTLRISIIKFYPYLILSILIFIMMENLIYFYKYGGLSINEVIFRNTFMFIIHIFLAYVLFISMLYFKTFGIVSGIILAIILRIIIDYLIQDTNFTIHILILLSISLPFLNHILSKQRIIRN